MPDYIEAHRFSSNHREKIIKDSICGCFYCLSIFAPVQIKEWVEDISGTAICPYCGVDSVIGDSSGYTVTHELLETMREYWLKFG